MMKDKYWNEGQMNNFLMYLKRVLRKKTVYLWQSDVSPTAVPHTEDVDELITGTSETFFDVGTLVVIGVVIVVTIEKAYLSEIVAIKAGLTDEP